MRNSRAWQQLIGVDDRTVNEGDFEDDDEQMVVHVRQRRPTKQRGVGARR